MATGRRVGEASCCQCKGGPLRFQGQPVSSGGGQDAYQTGRWVGARGWVGGWEGGGEGGVGGWGREV